jgi:hypothetical protein
MQTFYLTGAAEVYSFFDPRSGDRVVAIFMARLHDLEGYGIDGFEFLDQTGLDADEIFPLARIELGNRGPRNVVIFSQGGLITMNRKGMISKGLTSAVTDWDEVGAISISNNLVTTDKGAELFPFYSINKLSEDAMTIFSITESVGSFEELLSKADLEEEAQSHVQLTSADEKCALLLNDLARFLAAG